MKALLLYDDTFRLYADSASHRDRHPLFLPDGGDHEWMIRLCPCIRISRLGMNIAEKFAHRYYDSLGLAALLLPVGADLSSLDERYFAMDSAFTVGDMFPADEAVQFKVGDRLLATDSQKLNVDRTLSALSRFMTFKTGDLLIFSNPNMDISPVSENDEVVAYAANQICLDIKIK